MNRPNQSDIIALQHGLKNRAPARNGLRLYTADFDLYKDGTELGELKADARGSVEFSI